MGIAWVSFAVVAASLVVAAILYVRGFVHVCAPNELLIVCGRSRGGQTVFVRGGRAVLVPMLEHPAWMPVTSLTVRVQTEVWAEGAVPMGVSLVANLRVSLEDARVETAARCLLGKSREQVREMASNVLAGAAGVVASGLRADQLRNDPSALCEGMKNERPFDGVGMEIEALRVTEISG